MRLFFRKIVIPALFICLTSVSFAAKDPVIDSVYLVFRSPMEETQKVKHLDELMRRLLVAGKYDEMVRISDSLFTVSESMGFKRACAYFQYIKARTLTEKGHYNQAIEAALLARKLYAELNDKQGVANAHNGLGQTYFEKGNLSEALQQYLSALKIAEEINDKRGMAMTYNYLANIHRTMHNRKEMLKNYEASLKIWEELGDKPATAGLYNNFGNMYYGDKEYEKALQYYFKALAINKEVGRKKWMSNNYLGIGSVYEQLKDYERALENYQIALALKRGISDLNGIAAGYLSVGDILWAQKKYAPAGVYYDSALAISKRTGNANMLMESNNALMKLNRSKGDYKKALDYYELYSAAKDSILNSDNARMIAQMQSQFDSERKDNEIKLLNQEKKSQAALAEQESLRQRIIIWSIAGVLALVGVFSFLIFKRWKQSNSQKQIIEKQQSNILDSINYAKKIQKSVIPSEKEIAALLPFENFVLFMPRDIVSGDFYWGAEISQEGSCKYIIAAGDCTGHGVPGAFLTMMGSMLMNEIVLEKNIYDPALILQHLNKGIINSLSHGDRVAADEGMDISVCVIDQEKRTLEFAGAMNPVIVYNSERKELQTLKADSISIGAVFGMKLSPDTVFKKTEQKLSAGSCVYLFSDGYADQFSDGKKARFGTKRFADTLQKIATLPMKEQKEALAHELKVWQGNSHQLDDVLVIGIRI